LICTLYSPAHAYSLNSAGYPVITYFTKKTPSRQGGFNFGGTNSSGQVKISLQLLLDLILTLLPFLQVPQLAGGRDLIDTDTPQDVLTIASFQDSSQQLQLVFSDEFNVPGRTFWSGDDPYWEAVDLHYWATGNLEWYDPKAIITNNGALEITLSKQEDHNLNYTSGMLSSWNKFCFTGGLILANVSLPGASNVAGLWPAIWTLGNLGRAGYGASLDGLVIISSSFS
jgi:beta-glucanase (GH16 family)